MRQNEAKMPRARGGILTSRKPRLPGTTSTLCSKSKRLKMEALADQGGQHKVNMKGLMTQVLRSSTLPPTGSDDRRHKNHPNLQCRRGRTRTRLEGSAACPHDTRARHPCGDQLPVLFPRCRAGRGPMAGCLAEPEMATWDGFGAAGR